MITLDLFFLHGECRYRGGGEYWTFSWQFYMTIQFWEHKSFNPQVQYNEDKFKYLLAAPNMTSQEIKCFCCKGISFRAWLIQRHLHPLNPEENLRKQKVSFTMYNTEQSIAAKFNLDWNFYSSDLHQSSVMNEWILGKSSTIRNNVQKEISYQFYNFRWVNAFKRIEYHKIWCIQEKLGLGITGNWLQNEQ